MIPDPATGRILRAFAIALVAACALADGACGRAEPAAGQRRIASAGGPVAGTGLAPGAGGDAVAVDTSSVIGLD